MKIIQVGPDESRPGGIRTVMLALGNSALRARFGMDIVPTSSKTRSISTFLSGFRELKRIVKQGNCDCVHIHMSENASVYRTAAIIRWAKTRSRLRVIVQSHGGSVQKFFARCPRLIKKRLVNSLKMADLIVVLTPGWESWWKTILPEMRYAVIPNAVSMPSHRTVVGEKTNPSILFMGQLGERKGTYLLISAIPEVVSKHPEARFVFAGDGEIEQCASYAEKLQVSNNCTFVGWAESSKKENLLEKASMLVLPSKEESFGIVLLEAMSYGVPVICSDGGFMHEIVDDGKDGMVFPTGNKKALAEAICKLLDDPEKSRNMGESGRLKVEKEYALPAIIEIWRKIYLETCR